MLTKIMTEFLFILIIAWFTGDHTGSMQEFMLESCKTFVEQVKRGSLMPVHLLVISANLCTVAEKTSKQDTIHSQEANFLIFFHSLYVVNLPILGGKCVFFNFISCWVYA